MTLLFNVSLYVTENEKTQKRLGPIRQLTVRHGFLQIKTVATCFAPCLVPSLGGFFSGQMTLSLPRQTFPRVLRSAVFLSGAIVR